MTYNAVPKPGYIPVLIRNNTTQAASDIYIFFTGRYKEATGPLYFFALSDATNPPNGVFYPVAVTDTTFSANFSYQLSTLPQSSTGADDYLVYVPNTPSNRFYFSINSPIFLQSDATGSNIAPPTYYAFYDPNYSNLFESVEFSFLPKGGSGGQYIDWTATVNTTEVDAFGLPIRIQYASYDPANSSTYDILQQNPNALPSGFGQGAPTGFEARDAILSGVTSVLFNEDQTGVTPKEWPKLAIPFYTDPYAATGFQTYLRVLSPKQSVGNDAAPANIGGITTQHLPAVQPGPEQFKNYNYPPFPLDYLTAASYGNTNTFANNLFSHYTGGTNLYISTGGSSPTVYECVVSGTTPNQVLTCTGISGPNTGDISTLNESDLNTFKMYSGSQVMTGGTDADVLGFYFGDAFTVGFLGSSIGTSNSGPPPNSPINITDAVQWQPYYTSSYYSSSSFSGGPWYDVYAKALHAYAVRNTVSGTLNGIGLCYAYDFDDSLGISGAITPSDLTDKQLYPYATLILGEIDTPIPDPYNDVNTYDVTFNFAGTTLEYRNGGAWTPVLTGATVNGLTSNRTTPLEIKYTNGQGPTGDHYFNVYLYYQFMQPTATYNSSEVAIINASTITPNSATPTAFTINLLP